MMDFIRQLPHLEPYGDPQYFVYIILAILPIFVGLFFKKRFPIYEALVSFAFIIFMLTGPKLTQIYALLFYVIWQMIWVWSYKIYRKTGDSKWIFYLHIALSILPLFFVKVTPAIYGHQSLLGFLGISYLTFRSVGMIIELRDGVLKDFSLWEFLRFMLFMPTFSSGSIDRFKRFNQDYENIPERNAWFLIQVYSGTYFRLNDFASSQAICSANGWYLQPANSRSDVCIWIGFIF